MWWYGPYTPSFDRSVDLLTFKTNLQSDTTFYHVCHGPVKVTILGTSANPKQQFTTDRHVVVLSFTSSLRINVSFLLKKNQTPYSLTTILEKIGIQIKNYNDVLI